MLMKLHQLFLTFPLV
ncbi:hypothetical protein CFP56_033961 [Quercus suber]|uniref:Uncharacterized protein n=1 Tax=Quercus suber TaxID=58331 RepID=A0AAW0JDN2_QUESU